MRTDAADYWYSRAVFERALAFVYLIAFLCAANQFVPLLGEHGLLPITQFVREVPFRVSPSLFFFFPTDAVTQAAAWFGVALATLALSGYPQRSSTLASASVWAALWVLYLSFVNVGQTFYAFGWETLLLETGFFAIFAGGSAMTPNRLLIWIWRWELFRLMFGAGLIKLRGDACWRDRTCLDYYFETQPIPNPLSWYFHWLSPGVHHAGVVINHVVELGVPFLYFAPQPVAAIGGLVTMAFQLTLIASGNLSWLNWLTIVLAILTLDDRWWSWVPVSRPPVRTPSTAHRWVVAIVAVGVAILSVNPVFNLISRGQLMNYSFNTLHLVNTYGAFGSVTQTRNEIVIEGTSDAIVTDTSIWREYEFKGKPGNPARRPSQIAPYHLRIDWLMWFAAMGPPFNSEWFSPLLVKLLEGDPATLGLLETNPFPAPPRWVRARFYTYRFTTREERRQTGHWWSRRDEGIYIPPISLNDSP